MTTEMDKYYAQLAAIGYAPSSVPGKRVLGALIMADADQEAAKLADAYREQKEESKKPLTVKEAARIMNVSTGTIYGHIASGGIKVFRLGGNPQGGIRITREALEEFMAKQ